jgi:hypothetical protein
MVNRIEELVLIVLLASDLLTPNRTLVQNTFSVSSKMHLYPEVIKQFTSIGIKALNEQDEFTQKVYFSVCSALNTYLWWFFVLNPRINKLFTKEYGLNFNFRRLFVLCSRNFRGFLNGNSPS